MRVGYSNSSSEISSEKSDTLQQGPFQALMASFDSSFKRTASPTQPQRRTEWQGKCAGLKDAMSGLTCIAYVHDLSNFLQ